MERSRVVRKLTQMLEMWSESRREIRKLTQTRFCPAYLMLGAGIMREKVGRQEN